jgi:transcriptional regulator with XRE-family HTH domain
MEGVKSGFFGGETKPATSRRSVAHRGGAEVPKDAFRNEVALRLKEARREHTLTQRQLADLGLSTQQNISRYEKGFIPDSWFLLARLHSEKAIDLNWLLGASALSAAARGDGANGGDPLAARDGRPGAVPARATEPAAAAERGLAPSAVVAPAAELALLAEDEERGGSL